MRFERLLLDRTAGEAIRLLWELVKQFPPPVRRPALRKLLVLDAAESLDMTNDNPYDSPSSASGRNAVSPATRPPYVSTMILIFVGGCFLLLLNGQVFTNTLVFLGFIAVSGTIWMCHAIWSRQNTRTRFRLYVLLVHVVVLIAFTFDLPAKYRYQQEFNKRVRDRSRLAPWTVQRR